MKTTNLKDPIRGDVLDPVTGLLSAADERSGMKITDEFQSVRVPAGEYYLGDPCYFFAHEDWSKVLDTCDCFERPIGKAPGGQDVLGFGTAYGDGTFVGEDGFEYGVDAGMIGLVSVDGITRDREEVERLCNKARFNAPTLCTNAGGLMKFGHHVIDTTDGENS